MTQTAPAAPAPTGLDAAIPQLVGVLQQLGRNDLADRANAAGARLRRPATVVCVVGEFKQGKSSLVNGLLGRDACPVDDDVATAAITLVRYADEPAAAVRRRVEGQQVAEQIAIEDLPTWVTESGNPGNERGVERVEIAVPERDPEAGAGPRRHPGHGRARRRPRRGDARVPPLRGRRDPGVGRIGGAERARGRVPRARVGAVPDGAVRPVEDRPLPVVAAHPRPEPRPPRAQRCAASRPVVASSALRHEALVRKDRDLNERSQFPELIKALDEGVVTPAKEHAAERSAGDVHAIVVDRAHRARGGAAAAQRPQRADRDPALTSSRRSRASSSSADRAHAGARSSATASPTSPTTSRSGSARRCATISDQMDDQIENLKQGPPVGRDGARHADGGRGAA